MLRVQRTEMEAIPHSAAHLMPPEMHIHVRTSYVQCTNAIRRILTISKDAEYVPIVLPQYHIHSLIAAVTDVICFQHQLRRLVQFISSCDMNTIEDIGQHIALWVMQEDANVVWLREFVCQHVHEIATSIVNRNSVIESTTVVDATDSGCHNMNRNGFRRFWSGYLDGLASSGGIWSAIGYYTPMIYGRFDINASVTVLSRGSSSCVASIMGPIFDVTVTEIENDIYASLDDDIPVLIIGGIDDMADYMRRTRCSVAQASSVFDLCVGNVAIHSHVEAPRPHPPESARNLLSRFCQLLAVTRDGSFSRDSGIPAINARRGWCFDSALVLFDRCVPSELIQGYAQRRTEVTSRQTGIKIGACVYTRVIELCPSFVRLAAFKFGGEVRAPTDMSHASDHGIDIIVPVVELQTCIVFTCSVSYSKEKYHSDIKKIDDRIRSITTTPTMAIFSDHLPSKFHNSPLRNIHVTTVCIDNAHMEHISANIPNLNGARDAMNRFNAKGTSDMKHEPVTWSFYPIERLGEVIMSTDRTLRVLNILCDEAEAIWRSRSPRKLY